MGEHRGPVQRGDVDVVLRRDEQAPVGHLLPAPVAASAPPSDVPAERRSSTSAHRTAESTRASSVSSRYDGNRAASADSESGQPSTRPLWLKSHWPSV